MSLFDGLVSFRRKRDHREGWGMFLKFENENLKTKFVTAMEQLILNIKDKNKLSFLKKMLKKLEFVDVVEPKKLTAKKTQILSDIENAVDFVSHYKSGKVKAKSFEQLMNEL